MITRWAAWLRAALYYNEFFPAVRNIVSNWTGGELLVSRAKEAINVDNLMSDLVRSYRYRTLSATVKFIEGNDRATTEAYEL